MKESRALKHVAGARVRPHAGLRDGARFAGAVRAGAGPPVRRRPDDGAPGDGRPGRRGAARADPRQGHLRRPPAARRPARSPASQRGDEPPRPPRRVPDAPRPPRAGRSRRRPGAQHLRGRRGHPLEAAAPRRRRPDVPRGRLPQRGAAPGLPAERDADQPLRGARAARAAPTWAEDSVTADVCSPTRPSPWSRCPTRSCCGTAAAPCSATRWSRCRAACSARTGSRSTCSWARTAVARLRACSSSASSCSACSSAPRRS